MCACSPRWAVGTNRSARGRRPHCPAGFRSTTRRCLILNPERTTSRQSCGSACAGSWLPRPGRRSRCGTRIDSRAGFLRESEGREGFRFDTAPARRQDRRGSRLADGVILAIGVYLALAYLVLPTFWRHYEHLPPMADTPKLTRAPDGLPGDPLNVALVGSEADIQRAFADVG